MLGPLMCVSLLVYGQHIYWVWKLRASADASGYSRHYIIGKITYNVNVHLSIERYKDD